MGEVVAGRVTFHFNCESYTVTAGQTLLGALEEAGVELVRGVGCRGGVCGACLVFYRVGEGFEIKAGLMCQDTVQEGMMVVPVPCFPQKKAVYTLDLDGEEAPDYRVRTLYPEVNRCIMCGECTRICPMGLEVMGYVGMIKRGDLRGAARESFTCVQCQACAIRCPSQIPQPNAALAARRFHARHQVPDADHLTKSLAKMAAPGLEKAFRRLRRLDVVALETVYQRREREPDDAPPGTWLPEDRTWLL